MVFRKVKQPGVAPEDYPATSVFPEYLHVRPGGWELLRESRMDCVVATGNTAPSYKVLADGNVRPVCFYSVDMSEFAVNKLSDRGSLTARSILTNVQDFVVTVERGPRQRGG